MNDKTELKKVIHSFHNQASRFMRTPYNCFKADLLKFLSYIENTPLINDYVKKCISKNLPEGFSADAEVNAVKSDYRTIFGPFGGSDEEETAEIYLILQVLHKEGISGQSLFFAGYASGSKKFQDMLKGFLDKVAYILIEHIEGYLTQIGLEIGLDERSTQFIDVRDSPNSQINASSGQSTINATQNNNDNIDKLESLLTKLVFLAEEAKPEDIKLIQDGTEMLKEELVSGSPKRRTVDIVLATLRGINISTQFAAAVTQIAAFFSSIL